VISRGYGRSGAGCIEVSQASRPREVGDEPLLIRRRTGVPVFVAVRRVQAARALLAAHPEVDVLVSDDGLQHLALARDIEICVFDARGIGNGWLLPAGPLREPWPRPVDLMLCHGEPPGITGFAMRRRLAPFAQRADGSRIALEHLRGQPLHAVAAIAQPQVFFDMLRAGGLSLASTTALPDHHDLQGWSAPAGALLCTEKDAVKLWSTRPDAWAVPLELEIEPRFWQALNRLLDTRLSSRHGPQTA
jgi:tetraacyldisaccharide 4'-kinase